MKSIILLPFVLWASVCFSQNVDSLKSVISIQEKGLNAETDTVLANNHSKLGEIYWNAGQFGDIEPHFLRARDIVEKALGKAHYNYAGCLNNLAALYFQLGRYEKAEPMFRNAKTIYRNTSGPNNLNYADLVNNQAELYRIIGRYETAEPLFREALDLRGNLLGKTSPYYAISQSSLANLYSDMGRYEEAEPLYQAATVLLKSTIGMHEYTLTILGNQATFFENTGRYADAEPIFLEVCGHWKKQDSTALAYATSLNNLAALYSNTDRRDLAERLYKQAKNIRENRVGKESLEYAQSLNNLAQLYNDLKRYPEAEPLFEEAVAFWKKRPDGENDFNFAKILNNQGNLFNHTNRLEKAEPIYLQAIDIQQKTWGNDHFDCARSKSNLSDLYRKMGRFEEAERLLLEADGIRRRLIITAARHLSGRELSAYIKQFSIDLNTDFSFAESRRSEPSSSLSAAAFDQALFYKGFLLTSLNQMKRLAQANPVSAAQLEQLAAFHRQLAKQYSQPVAARKNVVDLEKKANEAEKELVRSVAGVGDALRQVSWQEVRASLWPGEAAVEFIHHRHVGPESGDAVFYAALVLQPGDARPAFIPLFEESEIGSRIERASANADAFINDFYLDFGSKSAFDLIWKPLEPLLKNVKTIWCSPSGLLHRINLGAISVANGRTFDETHRLILVGSTRQLVVLNRDTSFSEKTGVVIGGVRYEINRADTEADEEKSGGLSRSWPISLDSISKGISLPYLASSLVEAVNISQILQQTNLSVRLDTGYLATEDSFKKIGTNGPSPGILHVATHGFFLPDPKSKSPKNPEQPVPGISDNPMMRSGLFLAGAKQAWSTGQPPTNREDGILTAYEISQMNLSGTELVVLSACETGRGLIEGNEGVFGLQRAFKIAGANYLLMSLWKVNDRAAEQIMTLFYQNWLQNGQNFREAFLSAKAKMKSWYADFPFLWAGFVLVE